LAIGKALISLGGPNGSSLTSWTTLFLTGGGDNMVLLVEEFKAVEVDDENNFLRLDEIAIELVLTLRTVTLENEITPVGLCKSSTSDNNDNAEIGFFTEMPLPMRSCDEESNSMMILDRE
jgi:hypothetical protein